jgi:Recombination endonuclease VII
MVGKVAVCKDCRRAAAAGQPVPKRPALHPGPRCTTHHRVHVRRSKDRAHALYIEKTYGITAEQYWALYDAQGGCCATCQRATGRTKRLAVDHDHACCAGPISCGKCVRGLLCGPCNKDLIGRYTSTQLRRAADYKDNPPAQRILASLS